MLARLGPPLTVAVLAGPVAAGLAGTLLPAFGYLPTLGGDSVSLEPWRMLQAEPGLLRSVLLSIGTGLASTVLSLGLVFLFVAGSAGTPVFARIRRLVSPLLAVPHAAAAFGLAFMIAPSGMIARILSPELTGWQTPPDLLIVNDPFGLALVAGLTVKEIPFLFLIALAALPQLPVAQSRTLTASLGYGRIAGFLHASWSPLYRQMRLAVFAVLAFATSAVDVAMILGPTSPATLSARLVGWMADPDLSMRFKASAGAVLQLAVTAAALLIWIGLERAGAAWRDSLAGSGRRFTRDAALRRAGAWSMSLAAGIVLVGLAVLGLWSVAGLWQFPDALPASVSLDTWERALPRVTGPLGTTLLVAAASALGALLLVLLCLLREDETRRRPRDAVTAIVYIPLLVPQVSFLFGLQLLFLAGGSTPSLTALIFAHLVFVVPYVFLSLSDAWRAYDRRYEAVAAGLGKGRAAVLLRVKLPMLLGAVLAAWAVGFAVSVGQYLPTVLIGGRLTTVTTEAVALAAGGNRRVIGAWAFLQMLLPFAGFAIASLVPALLLRRFRAMRS